MKNFKLLLATTAILSAGAIVANAENPTVGMTSSVEVVVADDFKNVNDIDFGRWILPSNTKSLTLSMDLNGNVSTTTTGVRQLVNGYTGLTSGIPCNLLTFPDSVPFNNSYSSSTGTLSGIHATIDDSGDFECIIYADSMVITDTKAIASGTYIANFEITAVLE